MSIERGRNPTKVAVCMSDASICWFNLPPRFWSGWFSQRDRSGPASSVAYSHLIGSCLQRFVAEERRKRINTALNSDTGVDPVSNEDQFG